MAFIAERITNEEDRKYVAQIGFTYITGDPIDEPRSWVVDRERNMVLISRGGGGLEMPESYGMYIDNVLIDIEGHRKTEGSRYDNDLKVHWFIDWISVPKAWFESGCGTEKLKEIIVEAFTAYAYRGLEPSQVQEVTVEILAEPKQKYNAKDEEV
ncbi:MAG: hypothetical protein E7290_10165 [Lachnospiraceae bacterium]|nr:hypothetical protein [Lachnospiraceae bacterium]